jgi:hypothetical protein
LTSGGGAEAHVIVESGTPSWAEAPLFVLHADRSSAAKGPSFAMQYERSSAVARVADLTGFAPRSTGLFIAVSLRNVTQ